LKSPAAARSRAWMSPGCGQSPIYPPPWGQVKLFPPKIKRANIDRKLPLPVDRDLLIRIVDLAIAYDTLGTHGSCPAGRVMDAVSVDDWDNVGPEDQEASPLCLITSLVLTPPLSAE